MPVTVAKAMQYISTVSDAVVVVDVVAVVAADTNLGLLLLFKLLVLLADAVPEITYSLVDATNDVSFVALSDVDAKVVAFPAVAATKIKHPQ